jgi:diguanylate cyclase (GGDEF)-like protein
LTALFWEPELDSFELLRGENEVFESNSGYGYQLKNRRGLVNLYPFSYLRTKAFLWWALVGGLIGFLIIHPLVMIFAHLMLQQKLGSYWSILDIVFNEYAKIFSIQMLPWGISFALISAISGALYGRNRKTKTALLKSEKRFREMSITDDFTGLHNSRHFFNQLKQEIERTNRYGHPLTLQILDLDNFKRYNDTYGHAAGVEVLAATGKILEKSLRNTDSAYRYGGEEFTIILPETDGQDAAHFAERLRMSFESQALAVHKERYLSVTASIGVAQYKGKEEMAAFIKRADDNMYLAKKKGKNQISFST